MVYLENLRKIVSQMKFCILVYAMTRFSLFVSLSPPPSLCPSLPLCECVYGPSIWMTYIKYSFYFIKAFDAFC